MACTYTLHTSLSRPGGPDLQCTAPGPARSNEQNKNWLLNLFRTKQMMSSAFEVPGVIWSDDEIWLGDRF